MILVVSKYLLGKGFKGMSLWPFVIIRNREYKTDREFINHEKIHLRQQLELFILPFYIWYFVEFLFRFYQNGDSLSAYKNISFEREAYRYEAKDAYLKKRRFWAFLRYL